MIKKLILAVVAVLVLCLAGVLGLTSSQSPKRHFDSSEISRMPFELLTEGNFAGMPRVTNFTARDGTLLPYRLYKSSTPSNRKVYLLHDVGWHGMILNDLATSLAYAGAADIIVPDLRGHGTSPAIRGSAAYTGQLEDDLADLIKQTSNPGDRIIIGGYSFGGGLAIRFAAGPNGKMAQNYFLLAPFLGFSSEVNAIDADPWLQPLSRKIMGIKALNALGLDLLGSNIVLQLSYPKEFLNHPLSYTVTKELDWHLLSSLDPSPVLEDGLENMKSGLLVVAAGRDELFTASQYKPVISEYAKNAEFQIVDNANHINLLNSPKTLTIIQKWLSNLP